MKYFERTRVEKPRYNKFDLSHERKLSCQMGKLIPIMCVEAVPGDKFRVSSEIMARLAPMIAPVMHRVDLYVHNFFVPMRLCWNEFEKFRAQPVGIDGVTEPPVPPYIRIAGPTTAAYFGEGSLADHLGMPTIDQAVQFNDPININAMPFRAYQLIFNEWYRDQNLKPEVPVPLGGGQITDQPEIAAITALRNRAWEKDYLTSALPWTQRGPDVNIPIEGNAQVTYREQGVVINEDGLPVAAPGDIVSSNVGLTELSGSGLPINIDNIETVSLTGIQATINNFRRALALQKFFELSARVGSRFTEYLRGFFGVRSQDARLQRPEYLGGGKSPVVISEVLSTVQPLDSEGEPVGAPQGNMAGHGISVGRNNGFSYTAPEDGYFIVVLSMLPRTSYQNGIPRMFRRGLIEGVFDMYTPQFAHIGEQVVYQSEVLYDPAQTTGWRDRAFGYQSRYCEYKFMPSTVHGAFRSSLAYWHMGRQFQPLPANPPELNESFVESDPTKRIFAVTDPGVEDIYIQVYNRVDAIRPMPYFGTPTL